MIIKFEINECQKMDQQKGDCCWICFNTENNLTLTTEVTQKMLQNCGTYLDISISVNSTEIETPVSCCGYCYESAHEITLLKEQVDKLQKQISDLELIFSEKVVERRNRGTTGKDRSTNKSENCFVVSENSDLQSNSMKMQNMRVTKEAGESELNESTSESQDRSKTDNRSVFDNNGDNVVHPEDDIDSTHFYDETVSKVFGRANEQLVINQKISAVVASGSQQTVKIQLTHLRKCLKMPFIQLKRLQPCRSRNYAKMSATREETINCENISDDTQPDESSSLGPQSCSPEMFATAEETRNFKSSSNENQSDESTSDADILETHDLEDHNEWPDKKRSHTCSFCEKSFVSASVLIVHERSHTGERPFKCSSCAKSFSSRSILNRHKKTHEQNSQFNCSFCPKSFRIEAYLKSHEKIHSGEKKHKCSYCSKLVAGNLYHLRAHERIHTGERPYKCSFCEKLFREPTSLGIHQRSHTGERPFKCSTCSKSFTSSSSMRDHEKSHLVQKKYTCSFCNLSFIKQSVLKLHQAIHTGEKLYKCSSCEKTFQQKSKLKIHTQRNHAEITEEMTLPES